MMERARVLLLASSDAPIRDLADRLQDPDLDLIVRPTARAAQDVLENLGPVRPNVVIVDGSLPGREIFRFYSQYRASSTGADVPIVFTNHVASDEPPPPTTAPDYYLESSASLDDVEQLIFTFLPESMIEVEDEVDDEEPPAAPDRPATAPASPPTTRAPIQSTEPAGWQPPVKPSQPPAFIASLAPNLHGNTLTLALAYLGVYAIGEVLAAAVDPRLGLGAQAILLLAVFLHGANVSPGPERAMYWTLWLAPLSRIYALAQPYAGAQPLTWWALTAIPMLVAAVVAMRLVGLGRDDVGLKPTFGEVAVAVLMVPVGLAIGAAEYMVLSPRPIGNDLPFGGMALAALIVALNPAFIEELVFRGIVQRGVVPALGTPLGVLYVSLFYTALAPVGLSGAPSVLGLLLTFVVGLLLAALTVRTGSILSASAAHISLALSLYILAPALIPSDLRAPAVAPASTPTVDQRQPTARPVIVVSPGATPAAGQGAAPADAPSPAAAAAPTAITLAPPLSPSQILGTPVPGAAPVLTPAAAQPPGSTAPPSGQTVVVRGTGGAGARLRQQPGNSAPIITVLAEYTPLSVIGSDRIVDGLVWRQVRAPSGAEGWIAAQFVTSGTENPPRAP